MTDMDFEKDWRANLESILDKIHEYDDKFMYEILNIDRAKSVGSSSELIERYELAAAKYGAILSGLDVCRKETLSRIEETGEMK
jgi:hypothetical protein